MAGFTALDFETWEVNHDIILEIGISHYDAVEKKITSRHLIISDNIMFRNGRWVADHRDDYGFGKSEYLGLPLALDVLKHFLMSSLYVICHDCRLEKQVILKHFPLVDFKFKFLDTNSLYYLHKGNMSKPKFKLQEILEDLGIDYQFLHNAGNDARYILMAFLHMKTVTKGPGLVCFNK